MSAAVAYGEEAVMSYQLEMSAEIYDWLAKLRDSDPASGAHLAI